MIVVTGASGVIGRAFMARLHDERLPCVALDRDSLTHSSPLTSLVSFKPSVVVHLAAVVPQPPAIADDELNAARTREMDVRVLAAVMEWACHSVYASGCSLYRKDDSAPRREDEAGTENTPRSAYLVVKQQGERNFLASGQATVLRIAAPIGEGLPRTTVVGRFMAAAKGACELEIWGSGQREQNYVDVVDIADALFRSLIIRPSELINIAADQPITMLELARQTVQAFGGGFVRIVDKRDPRDGETARYSNKRAADLLGWRPTIPIQDSLRRLGRGVP